MSVSVCLVTDNVWCVVWCVQCDDSVYTNYGKVLRGAGRAIAISGWSSLFFTTAGAGLGMIGSVFEGVGEGNGIAICFFIFLIILALWGLWRLIKNRKAARYVCVCVCVSVFALYAL